MRLFFLRRHPGSLLCPKKGSQHGQASEKGSHVGRIWIRKDPNRDKLPKKGLKRYKGSKRNLRRSFLV